MIGGIFFCSRRHCRSVIWVDSVLLCLIGWTGDALCRKPLLEPKHKIFLSHSGAQKSFTEQLCKDLERVRYFPFFDRRPHSLPKGENFPELIFQAAQQCQVAVLILSQEYFVRSKWPMLELEAFVESRKDQHSHIKILPVYFRISRHDCICNSAKLAAWLSVWRDWSNTDRRINVSKWTDALEVLDTPDCIEYGEAVSEVALREQIVARVCNLIPPEYRWVEGHVQGRSYLCKVRGLFSWDQHIDMRL